MQVELCVNMVYQDIHTLIEIQQMPVRLIIWSQST